MDRFFLLTCVAHPVQRTVYTCLFIIMKSIQNMATERYCRSVWGRGRGSIKKRNQNRYTAVQTVCYVQI